ncbi:MAG: hypothetical protein NT141_01820 [candidate division WWE3 bacterium]|nr:hypothetical protein [candidate division WWE3 bacterium]
MEIPVGYVLAEVIGVKANQARFVVVPDQLGKYEKPGVWFHGQRPSTTPKEALARFLNHPKVETQKCLNAFKKDWCGAK